ncbi:hypothetical protein SAMN05421678_118121 [Actinopolymorpha cephalotaxi]|uniref:Uncharacterized protein n=1 Tax=Actinopolymorpha cephalotaxi TaxID=504797 RepID=A0A1I3A9W6_9ACTN|nr:hypothetical protein [Actinopolymorpha cephalotaxi]NYH85264.1 hypothetical protein [Actinopolymorpha cephalotaxi]SFH46735.1 hypothetical protein SAMN05421678_118121 [Actinopolymorpha cephalotaxi]
MTSLPERHGSAKRPDRSVVHRRPDGVSDATVAALGKLSEALEIVEHARGALFEFHRLCGSADLTLQDAVAELRTAGHGELAEEIEDCLVGRDVVDGMWSFQLVEAYDQHYWSVFRDVERIARDRAGNLPRHLFEAELKHREQGGTGDDVS